MMRAIQRLFARAPDVLIGGPERPYMKRWHILPRNPILNIYLHRIERSDDDRALHDHPWWNASIVLAGGYFEVLPVVKPLRRGSLDYWFKAGGGPTLRREAARQTARHRGPGALVFRKAKAAHRLIVHRPAWTLFITGPRFRSWGFYCPQGWIDWRAFTDPADRGRAGRGCD